MKIKRSFFIRWLLLVDEEKQERSVIDVEHVQSGGKTPGSSMEEASEWIKRQQTVVPAVEEL